MDSGVLHGEHFVTSEELDQRARRAAAAMTAARIGAGDAVALLMRNDLPFIEASLATSLLGAYAVPINWHGSAEEVEYVLNDCGAKLLVAHADLYQALVPALTTTIPVVIARVPDDVAAAYSLSSAVCEVPSETEEWCSWRDRHAPWTGDPTSMVESVVYTSGTTGRPKGVRRAPASADDPDAQRAYADIFNMLGLDAGMRTVITGPMYHVAPNIYGLNALRHQGFAILQPRFDPEELLALIEEHRITHLHMVPTMFVRLLHLPEQVRRRYDISSLRHVVHAAAPCPPQVKSAMIDEWGPIIHEYYGCTEAGAIVACTSAEWLDRPGTVGRPLPSARVAVLNDEGKELPPGEVGEVYMRLDGYPDFTYNNLPHLTGTSHRGDLMTAGDIGYLDEEGYLYLSDRKTDMIISGGVNIYPAEIEATLATMPGLRDAAVFGVPHAEYGESVMAAVELLEGADVSAGDVQAYLRERVANYKVPRTVVVHTTLPREDSGKILKRKLRDPHWETAGRKI